MLRGWGIGFIFFGLFWTVGGFLSYATDIQLGIAVSGINMVGIGILMLGIDKKLDGILLKLSPKNNESQK